MQLLYAINLDVGAADPSLPPPAVFELLQQHVSSWLSFSAPEPFALEDFDVPGGRSTPQHRGGGDVEREAVWQVLRTGGDRGLRLALSQPLPGLHAQFVCRVTVTLLDGKTTLRVAMGRDSGGGLVSAIPVEHLRRPGLLGLVLRDATLDCRIMRQPVTGRFVEIRPGESVALFDALDAQHRLPLLLVDASRSQRWDEFARSAGRELAGLATVVRLRDPLGVSDLRGQRPEQAPPDAGGRLVWPALDARHPVFSSYDLNRPERTVGMLMRLISPFAVAARGRDLGWTELQRRVRRDADDALLSQVAEAAAAGNAEQQIELLTVQVATARQELEDFVEAFGAPEDQQRYDDQLAQARAEADSWKELYFGLQRARPEELPWVQRVPDCADGDVTALYNFLHDETGGAIVFTPAAVTSWRKCNYPFPDDMRDALVALAQAALEWREKHGDIGSMPDDWIKVTYGYNSAFSDHGLKKLATFEFEGEQYDRTPHLKLDDNTSPDRVGRVYFALDKKQWRFVVDHVGLKLYGL